MYVLYAVIVGLLSDKFNSVNLVVPVIGSFIFHVDPIAVTGVGVGII